MEQRLKQRLVGAAVLVSLAVVFVPILLDVPERTREDVSVTSINRDSGSSELPNRAVGDHHAGAAGDATPRCRGWNASATGKRRARPPRITAFAPKCPRGYRSPRPPRSRGTRDRRVSTAPEAPAPHVHIRPARAAGGACRGVVRDGGAIAGRCVRAARARGPCHGDGGLDRSARELSEGGERARVEQASQGEGIPGVRRVRAPRRGVSCPACSSGPCSTGDRRRTRRRSCGAKRSSKAS